MVFGLFLLLIIASLQVKKVSSWPRLFITNILKNQAKNLSKSQHLAQSVKQNNKSSNANPQVLGDTSKSIYISATDDSYTRDGVINLSSFQEPSVFINTYNITDKVELKLYKVTEDDLLNYLVHDKDNYLTKKNVDADNDYEFITSKEVAVESQANSKVLLPLDETGIWYLQVKEQNSDFVSEAFIVRSNLALLTITGDNEFVFWAQDLASKRSLDSGEVTLYSLENEIKPLGQVNLKSDGTATHAIRADAEVAILKSDDKMAFSPINLTHINTGWNYDEFTERQTSKKYFAFTDRPLYMPGDTVHFKVIARTDDDAVYTLPSAPITIQAFSGYDQKDPLFSKTFNFNSYGTIEGEYTLPEDIDLGYHEIKVKNNDYNEYLIEYQVEYYRKPEYFLDVTVDKNSVIQSNPIEFTIKGQYFSGQVLANKTVNYEVKAYDAWNYSYYNPYYLSEDAYSWISYYGGYSLEKGTVTLDERGQATVKIQARQSQEATTHQIISIEANFTDETGNSVTAAKNTFMYQSEYDIFRKNFEGASKINQEVKLPLKLHSYVDKSVSGIALNATIILRTWEKYAVEGEKYPRYEEKTKQIAVKTITSDGQGEAAVTFIPTEPGSYEITVNGKDSLGNLAQNNFYIYVSSHDQPTYNSSGEVNLDLTLDKDQYEINDTAIVNLTSAIASRDVLLAVERGFLETYQVVSLNGQNAEAKIGVDEKYLPNVFVKAYSFSNRTLETQEKELLVNTDSRKLQIAINPDSQKYGPGDNVKLDLKVTDSSGQAVQTELAVWLVDKALFELAGNTTGDIFNTFWQKRWHYTPYIHSFMSISNYGGAERGGGCFTAGHKVLMADGNEKNIEDIKVGEEIYTFASENSLNLVKTQVLTTTVHDVDSYIMVNDLLKVTPEHLVYSNKGFVEIGSLRPGDYLLSKDGLPILIETMEFVREKVKVYNLETANQHTFIVNGVYVHNQKGGGAREVFKDTAYWNPRVVTDENGQATVSFKLPDNLTTWAVAALGIGKKTEAGQATTDIVVTKDIIVRPVLPNIIRDTDKIEISALVHNFTDQDQVFEVELEFDSGKVTDARRSGILIKANSFEQIVWPVSPEKTNEAAKFTFSAWKKDDEKVGDVVVVTVPVKAFGFHQLTGFNGLGNKTFNLNLSPEINPAESSVSLQLASTLTGGLVESMHYLVGYPYGCVEQTTSKLVPNIIALANPDLYAEALKDKDQTKLIDDGLDRLEKLQTASSGWGWWYDNQPDIFITSYVVEFLQRAQELNLTLKQHNRIKSLLARIKSNLASTENSNSAYQATDPNDQVALYYLKSYLGINDSSDISNFESLTDDSLALLVMANYRSGNITASQNGLDKLISRAQTQGDTMFWKAGKKTAFGSSEASTALALKALVMTGADRELAAKASRYLLNHKKANYFYNTFATAQALDALTSFAKAGSELTPNFSYQVYLDDQEIAAGRVDNTADKIEKINLAMAKLKANSQIKIDMQGEGQLYSTLLVDQYINDPKAKEEANNIKISRRYVDEAGNGLKQIKVGDLVTVELIVEGLKNADYYGIIEDKLPSGLIPLNYNLDNVVYDQRENFYHNWYYEGVKETQLDGMNLAVHEIPARQMVYSYQARAVSRGEFLVPPAQINMMYAPEINAHTATEKIKITGEKETYLIQRAGQKEVKFYQESDIREPEISLWGNLLRTLAACGLIVGTCLIWQKQQSKKINKTEKPQETAKKEKKDDVTK